MSWLPRGKVLVPIDFSEESFAALEVAGEFTPSPASLRLLHVLPRLSPMEPGVIWGTVDDRGRRDHAEEALRKRLEGTPFAAAPIAIEVGDPYREIVHYAERERIDLIVVPSHGHGGIHAPHFLIGSVAERVARHAHCPVLILRK